MASNQSVSETKKKIFKCKQCNIQPFTQKSHLNSHIRLKHSEESGKRECVRCTSAYSQINYFIVHYKKEHMSKECDSCNGKKLCTLCDLDLKSAKVEWQLKPLEVDSPDFETVGGHVCEACKMSFREKFQLNAHIKLKHNDLSSPGVCTKCSASFAQMNNFVVHLKKKHLNKDCMCNGGKLCNECAQNLVHAKELWAVNKAKSTEDPKPAKITKPVKPATVQATLIAPPTLTSSTGTTLLTTDSLATTSTSTQSFAAVPAFTIKPIANEIVRRKSTRKQYDQVYESFEQYQSIIDCGTNTKNITAASTATTITTSNATSTETKQKEK